MERRGSRARRRLLAIETGMTEPNDGVLDSATQGDHSREGDEDNDPPVIDTTSVEVERKADGSVTKVNEYIIVRDLGCGSSAEVKLCQLVIPTAYQGEDTPQQKPSMSATCKEGGQGGDVGLEGQLMCTDSAETAVEGKDQWRAIERAEDKAGEENFCNDLYAVKIFDRSVLMRRGALFARTRARDQDGALLPVDNIPENYLKVQREISIMKKLVHPNLVQLVEVIDAPRDRSLYMVMEYVERGAVMRCVDPGNGRYECPSTGGTLDDSTAARFFSDILAGLEYLHLHLIAHRDLKPENVLIGDDGHAKIADFGVSQYFPDDEPRTPKSARSLARSTSRAQMSNTEGTWSFWAPEVCGSVEDKPAFNAFAADAWAAGVTLWCFLYGTVPFFSLNPIDLFISIADYPAPIPSGADTALRDLLERLLAKDPAQRLTVPEARDHDWVRSRVGARGGVQGVDSLRSMAQPTDGSERTPFASSSDQAAGDAEPRSGAAVSDGGVACVGDGDCGCRSSDVSCSGDAHRSGKKVAVTEDDVRAAVTRASGFVVVAKFKSKVQGMQLKVRRLSGKALDTSRQPKNRDNSNHNVGGSGGADATSTGGRDANAGTHDMLLECGGRREGEKEERKHDGTGATEHFRRRASSTACAVS